jgi:hypothetical protein
MLALRSLLIVGLSLAVTTSAVAAPKTTRRQRHPNSIEGTVVQVHRNRLHRNTGWIKIRHRTNTYSGRRRGNSTLAAAALPQGSRRVGYTTTYTVIPSTRFQRLGVRGRQSRLGLGSIHNGDLVRIYLGGSQGTASVVNIIPYSHRHRRHYYANGNGNYGSYYGRNGNYGSYYGRNNNYGSYYGRNNNYGSYYGRDNNYGSYYGRPYGYNRNPLYGSRVLAGIGNQQPIVVNRSFVVNRPTVVRSVRNPLIQGQVAARKNQQVVAAPVTNPKTTNPKTTKTVVNKPTPTKQKGAHKPTQTTHKTTHKPASSGHSHSSSHRKK